MKAHKFQQAQLRFSNQYILAFILLVAAILRFYHLAHIPLTHDEFSALFRLHFNNFHDLIEKGVKVDGHPAGVQVFLYYWTKLVGFSSTAMKIPFILFGIISVYLSYLVSKQWFNVTVGLIVAAIVCCLEYTITYSQIIRPYGSGFMFSLLLVYFFTKLVQSPEKRFYRNSLFFILSGALCAYDHYFALLFAALVGFSGLFFIKKIYRLKYIIMGVLIFLLFAPYLPIFFTQLSYGGLEWLAKPKPIFIFHYLYYLLNFSYLFILTIAGIIIWSIASKNYNKPNYKHYSLFFLWFILPFLIGYFYSVYFHPVLEFSCLIFSFIYLFFLLFGHIKACKPKTNLILVLSIMIVGIYSLLYVRNYYKNFYQSIYTEILNGYNKAKKSPKKTLSLIFTHDKINHYYAKKLNVDTTNYTNLKQFKSPAKLNSFLYAKEKQYPFLYLGTTSFINPIFIPIIEKYYPTIEAQQNYWGGTTYLFSKKKTKKLDLAFLGFEKEKSAHWKYDTSYVEDSASFAGRAAYQMTSKQEWGPTFTANLNTLQKNKNNFIDISVQAKNIDSTDEIILVASIEAKGKTEYWVGEDFKNLFSSSVAQNGWNTYYVSLKMSDIYLQGNDNIIKSYVWNKSKSNFLIDNYTIRLRKGNPIIYGSVEPK